MLGEGELSGRRSGRRRFLSVALSVVAGILFLEVVRGARNSFRSRGRERARKPSEVIAGPAGRFGKGTVTAFEDHGFFLVRLEDGGFLALNRDCTHVGCPVTWDAGRKRFVCPCHASLFDISGDVLRAPAQRPLDLLETRIKAGIVLVDPASRTQRSGLEADQATYT